MLHKYNIVFKTIIKKNCNLESRKIKSNVGVIVFAIKSLFIDNLRLKAAAQV